MQNSSTLDITNNGQDTIIFKPEETLGILDLRSLGYYKVIQGIYCNKIQANTTDLKKQILYVNILINL